MTLTNIHSDLMLISPSVLSKITMCLWGWIISDHILLLLKISHYSVAHLTFAHW